MKFYPTDIVKCDMLELAAQAFRDDDALLVIKTPIVTEVVAASVMLQRIGRKEIMPSTFEASTRIGHIDAVRSAAYVHGIDSLGIHAPSSVFINEHHVVIGVYPNNRI